MHELLRNPFFIAKCLTISQEEKNRDQIELILKTPDVDIYKYLY